MLSSPQLKYNYGAIQVGNKTNRAYYKMINL